MISTSWDKFSTCWRTSNIIIGIIISICMYINLFITFLGMMKILVEFK